MHRHMNDALSDNLKKYTSAISVSTGVCWGRGERIKHILEAN